ncbi:hypothetical protein Sste5344_007361 [Sporothrix stenoceras]
MTARVLYIGLGNIGRGMAKNIANKANIDQPILLFNRSPQRSLNLQAELSPDKATIVDSIAAGVAQADVVFLCVIDDKSAEETVDEILKSNVQGKLIINCTTVSPTTSDKLGQLVEATGADYVASPVVGQQPVAEAGELLALLSGPEASVKRALPFYKGVTARAVVNLSGQPYGKALTLKIVGNTLIFSMVEQVAESLVFAEKAGLGTDAIHSWVENVFGFPFSYYSERMVSGDYYRRDYPAAHIDGSIEVSGHAKELASAVGAHLPILDIVVENLAKIKEIKGDKGDLAGIYGIVRMKAGLPYENQE